ncbi:MAG: esterase [Cyanobacteria bacterium]|nr:esterase [Cyanobacteriota bacterium]
MEIWQGEQAVGEALQSGPEAASKRLVLLHGWGADADDLLELGRLLCGERRQLLALRAPQPHPGGLGRQWYDLQNPTWPDLPAARLSLRQRLEALGRSLPLEHTVVLGFSQGAAMALDVGSELPLEGIVSCSGYPHPGWHASSAMARVLLTHGKNDPVVPYAASEELLRLLRLQQAPVELLSSPGQHGIDPELLPAIRRFIDPEVV